MRPAPRTLVAIALTLAALLGAATAIAKPTGLQLELRGLGAQPAWSGSSSTAGFGGGSGMRALYGWSRHLYLGLAVEYFKNRKDYAYAVALPGPPGFLLGPRVGRTIVGAPGHRTIATLPFEALAQYRTASTTPLNLFAELGGGVTTTNAKLSLGPNSLAGSVQMPSLLAGAGAVYAPGKNWEITASCDWHQAWHSAGKVWSRDDSPRFLTFGLGVRYPRF